MTGVRVVIRDDTRAAVELLAGTMDVDAGEVVKRAVACLLLLEGHRTAGDRVLVERPTGTVHEVRPSWWPDA